jgi:hypothetical protein
MLANIHVLHDIDPAPDRFACMVEVWRDVRLLDARGLVNNAIVMAGAVATLERPACPVPDDAANEIVEELARMAFLAANARVARPAIPPAEP